MKSSGVVCPTVLVAVLLVLSGSTVAQVIPGRHIAVLKPGVPLAKLPAQAAATAHGVQVGYVYEHSIKGFAFAGSVQAAEAIAKRKDVAYVLPDIRIYAWQATVTYPTGVDRADAEKVGLYDGRPEELDVDVAVIDSGIDVSHPDLNVVGGKHFYTQGLFRLKEDDNYDDDNGHGTHVAGTIGAYDDGGNAAGVDVVGVAPGSRLWAVKVLGANGSGSASEVIAGVDWVAKNAETIEVANMSLGAGYYQALNDAVEAAVAAGVVFVVAAGNEDDDASNYSPASAPNAVTVSALADADGLSGGVGSFTYSTGEADDTLATFSNYGVFVDICAPGVDILSTYPDANYVWMSGTSMAAPHVAGAIALYLAAGYDGDPVAQVLSTGWTTDNAEYFGGDKDAFSEPLLNTFGLVGNWSSPENRPPVAEDDLATTANTAADGILIDVLANDYDPDGDELTISIPESPASGSAEVDGLQIRYTPAVGYAGEVTFEYTVSDGELTASACVTVTVTDPNTVITMTDGEVFLTIAIRGRNLKGTATVQITEVVSGLGVSGAQVSGDWTLDSDFVGAGDAITDAEGYATFVLNLKDSGVLGFTVTSVSKDGYDWVHD